MGHYHTSQICLNGHVATDCIDTNPELNQKFCDKCGSETITSCPKCLSKIRGYYESETESFQGYDSTVLDMQLIYKTIL